jgi:hypothetical protein
VPAVDGAAAGMVSTDIGVYEPSDTLAGYSLQLAGTGNTPEDFTWIGPVEASPGQLNAGQNVLPSNDPDLDGMPSDWEELYFGGPTNAVPHEDPDLDGFTNLEEYVADTIPTDGASYFRIETVQSLPAPGIGVQSSSDRLYALEGTAELTGANGWSELAVDIPGTGGVLLLIDTNAADGLRLYRARVRVP